MVGAVIGWVFLCLLAVLLVLLILPVTLGIEMEEGRILVWGRILFVKIKLFPMKERKPKAAKPKTKKKKAEEKEEKTEAPPKKNTLESRINLVKRIGKSASVAMKHVLKHIRIKDVSLVLPVYAGDASATAVRCGQVQAMIGGTHAVLDNLLHVSYKQLIIVPDFAGQWGSRTSFSCKIVASPVIMLAATIMGLWQFLFYKKTSYTKAEYIEAQRKKRSEEKDPLAATENNSQKENADKKAK